MRGAVVLGGLGWDGMGREAVLDYTLRRDWDWRVFCFCFMVFRGAGLVQGLCYLSASDGWEWQEQKEAWEEQHGYGVWCMMRR